MASDGALGESQPQIIFILKIENVGQSVIVQQQCNGHGKISSCGVALSSVIIHYSVNFVHDQKCNA